MIRKLSILVSLCFLFTIINAQNTITVKLNYGDEKPAETFQVNWNEGMTALLAVQSCANVATHPVKEYIFVHTINDVSTIIGEKAWYYTVNNESTRTIAFRYFLKPGDTIEWIYKKDVCSGKKQETECEK